MKNKKISKIAAVENWSLFGDNLTTSIISGIVVSVGSVILTYLYYTADTYIQKEGINKHKIMVESINEKFTNESKGNEYLRHMVDMINNLANEVSIWKRFTSEKAKENLKVARGCAASTAGMFLETFYPEKYNVATLSKDSKIYFALKEISTLNQQKN